ncbi:mercuric reductase [Chitinispirillales bacterium ANBcel5]|uniref:mercuric reductase n=1 Tax=Cellulosispirillum alkaliphilum TaxID=3039283 RepID=UPI002A4EDD23|nr:mercuric reductase [Chitinispirillales bacterium ANBcel5]
MKPEMMIQPMDQFNQVLFQNTHPARHQNPTPKPVYDLVVIGAGSSGLVTSVGAAQMGARVALIERMFMGGCCLNFGCVPSKALIRSARVAYELGRAKHYGICTGESLAVDFASVMRRVRQIRAKISYNDSVETISNKGVDVFLGEAHFIDKDHIEVANAVLPFKLAAITAGGRPMSPRIDGIDSSEIITSKTLFTLTELPSAMAVIGGGPIGCEMAQAFARFGTKVTIFHAHDHLLDKEDADAAELIQNRFKAEGIQVLLNSRVRRGKVHGKQKTLYYIQNGEERHITVDAVLAGAGRKPSVEDLRLENVGVEYDPKRGIHIDDHLRTTNKRIFSAGEICMKWKFTHAAEASAQLLLQNALLGHKKRLSDLIMPWCTYTDPEIAHVGMYEKEAVAKGYQVETVTQPMSAIDRAITDSETEGFVRVHLQKGKNRILGASIIAKHAGEMINEITAVMNAGGALNLLSKTIYPYPTQSEAIKRVSE